MKTSDHEQKLHLDGTEKPGFQKILACHSDFRNPHGGPRHRADLDDKYFYGVAKNSGTEPERKKVRENRVIAS
jgi:hypothetical protein